MSSHEVRLLTSNGHRQFVIDDAFCESLRDVPADNYETVKLFVISWLTLLSDSPLDPGNKPVKLYRRFLQQIAHDGLKATVLGFSDLAHRLVSQHTLMGPESSIGDWISEFVDTPVFFEYNRYYKTGDVEILRFLYTFLNFGKKLEFVDKSFEKAAFRSWLDVEKRLTDLTIPEVDSSVLQRILEELLPRFEFSGLYPKFGPGSVSERGVRGRISKLDNLAYDPVIDRFLLRGHLGKYGYGDEVGLTVDSAIPGSSKWTPDSGISSRVARLMFVPKNLKTARSICMEPNTLMYFQQACLRQVLELLESSPLRHFIDIKDQTRNQLLARLGSYTGLVDTIDLSAASDSLSYDLVKKVFPPSWQIFMRATRSSLVELPDGSKIAVKKFAPMGSALCFPTQCIIFASVCIYAAMIHRQRVELGSPLLEVNATTIRDAVNSFSRSPLRIDRAYAPMAVYGDDICVDTHLTPIVLSILTRLGFVPNVEKSFVGGQAFRESCGKFYLDDTDLTPLYFRVKGVSTLLGAEQVASQVHLINECFCRRYKNTYRLLIRLLRTWECRPHLRSGASVNSIPYVSPDSQILGIHVSSQPENTHLERRENVDYQRTEIRCWTTAATSKRRPNSAQAELVERYEYMRWWACRASGGIPDSSESAPRFDSSGTALKWRWMPLQ